MFIEISLFIYMNMVNTRLNFLTAKEPPNY